jgi:hypothetical protein
MPEKEIEGFVFWYYINHLPLQQLRSQFVVLRNHLVYLYID